MHNDGRVAKKQEKEKKRVLVGQLLYLVSKYSTSSSLSSPLSSPEESLHLHQKFINSIITALSVAFFHQNQVILQECSKKRKKEANLLSCDKPICYYTCQLVSLQIYPTNWGTFMLLLYLLLSVVTLLEKEDLKFANEILRLLEELVHKGKPQNCLSLKSRIWYDDACCAWLSANKQWQTKPSHVLMSECTLVFAVYF